MKFVKRLFIALLIIIILAGASVYVLITFYKKELTAILIDTLKTNYGLTLKVEDIKVSFFSNWPHASVQLKDIYVASDLNPGNTEPILKAGSVDLSFNLEKMLQKQFIVKNIAIKDAEIRMFRNKEGVRNFEFKKQEPDSSSEPLAISFEINKVSIRNVQYVFINETRGQKVAISLVNNTIRLKQYADGADLNLEGKIFLGGLLFNPNKGEFLHNTKAYVNLDVTYFKDSQRLCVKPSSYTEIMNHRYDLCSLVDLGENKKLSLIIRTKKADYHKVNALLTQKIRKVLSNFDVKHPVDADVLIVANLGKKEDPILLVNVEGKNNDLAIGHSRIPYSDLAFRGKIISLHPSHSRGDIDNARLVFEPVKGKIYDLPFTAKVTVKNLVTPTITIRASLFIEAARIKSDLIKDFELKGSATAKIHYRGPTDKLNTKEFLEKPMSLNAELSFKDLSYKEKIRPYIYTVNGKAQLDNRDLKFDNLNLKTDIAEAVLKGKADGFVKYVLGYTKGFTAHLAARTESLNLNPLLVKNEAVQKDPDADKDIGKKIDQSHFEFNVNLFAKKMVLRKVEATNATVDLYYKDNFLNIKSLTLNTCDGRLFAKATIQDFNKIKTDVSVQNVNVNKLFGQFENFGQEAIVDDNLKGDLSLDAKFKVDLDENMEFKGESMAGEVKLKLKDGHLINFEPVQNLSNFLFRNRNFNDVTFSELNETFKVKGYEMQIEELEIGSNILNLYVVNGLYNFKGNSNINILIPWSNLKKRGKNYIPKNSGESAENTKGVKLNFYGPKKNMKISFGHKEQEKKF